MGRRLVATGAASAASARPASSMRLAALDGRRTRPGPRSRRAGRSGPGGPSVPVHRMADHRGGRPAGPRAARADAGGARPARPRPGRGPGRPRGRGAPAGRDPTWSSVEAGFADDTGPPDALVAVPDGRGGYAVAETLGEARAQAGKVQGRSTGLALDHPGRLPPGDVGPRRCGPPGWSRPTSSRRLVVPARAASRPPPYGNGGAFGGKLHSPVAERRPAPGRRARRPVRVLLVPRGRGAPRAQATPGGRRRRRRTARGPPGGGAPRRLGPARWRRSPPGGRGGPRAGARGGRLCRAPHLARPPGRGVGRGRRAGRRGPPSWRRPGPGARSRRPRRRSRPRAGGRWPAAGPTAPSTCEVDAGEVLDAVVLRSYCIGAAHQALGWVRSEGMAVDADGRRPGPDHALLRRSCRPGPCPRSPSRWPRRRRPGGQRFRRGLRGRGRGPLARRRPAVARWPTGLGPSARRSRPAPPSRPVG